MVCPFCKKDFETVKGSHLKMCAHKNGFLSKSKEELRFIYMKENFGCLCDKSFFEKEYDSMSIPDFKKKYGDKIDPLFLCRWFGIKTRSISEASHKFSLDKYKKTCLEKYGATNALSKGTSAYKKRNNTVKEKYGVDNVFQIKEIVEKINSDDLCLQRHGITRKELLSRSGKEAWLKLSDEEKDDWLSRSIFKKSFNGNDNKRNGINTSKLESKVAQMLLDLKYSIETQFLIRVKEENKKHRWKFYDILIKDFDIIIEVNGNYWHANPKIYKEDDLIPYFGNIVSAGAVWENDKIKKDIAEKLGYKVIYIWEDEVTSLTPDKLKELIIDSIKNGEKYI